MFDGGLRPPINLYPIVPPALVSGAEVEGNSEENNQVTEQGKTFLLTVINMLHSSIKVFGDEEEIPWYDVIWPGVETEDTVQNKSQFVGFVGESEEEAVDWGNFSRVDYDFDGVTDVGRTIEDALPYELYKILNQDNSIVSIDSLWKENQNKLSADDSFGQVLTVGHNYPETSEGKFALLTGLLQTKRNWVYGLSALGLNAYNLNEEGALNNFLSKFNSPIVQEAGGINLQILLNYICLTVWGEQSGENEPEVLKGVNVRFDELANDAWINNEAINGINGAKAYYHTRALNVNINRDRANVTGFRSALGSFRDLLNADGSIKFPARRRGESDASYAGRRADTVSRLTSLQNTMKNALNGLGNDYERIDSDFGLVSSEVKEDEAAFTRMAVQFSPSVPQEGSNLSAMRTLLGQIDSAITNIDSAQQGIKDNTDAVVQMLFDEFKAPLSREKTSDELGVGILVSFQGVTDKTLNYVSGVMGVNTAFSAINKNNKKRYEQQKDDKRSEEMLAMKSSAKHRSSIKSEEKREQNSMSAHSLEKRRTESKQSMGKSNRTQPKQSLPPAGRKGR